MPRRAHRQRRPPAEMGEREGSRMPLFLPTASRSAASSSCTGGLPQGVRTSTTRALRTHGLAAVAFDQRGRGTARLRWTRAWPRTSGSSPSCSSRASREPCADRAWADTSRSWRPSGRAPAPWSRSARRAQRPARGVRAGRFEFTADAPSLDAFLAEHDELVAAADLACPLLLLHAEGDEQVPIAHSAALAAARTRPGSRRASCGFPAATIARSSTTTSFRT